MSVLGSMVLLLHGSVGVVGVVVVDELANVVEVCLLYDLLSESG